MIELQTLSPDVALSQTIGNPWKGGCKGIQFMMEEVTAINTRDLKVKVHPRHKYAITDFDLKIVVKFIYLFL